MNRPIALIANVQATEGRSRAMGRVFSLLSD